MCFSWKLQVVRIGAKGWETLAEAWLQRHPVRVRIHARTREPRIFSIFFQYLRFNEHSARRR